MEIYPTTVTVTSQMDTPSNRPNKPSTRSANKKAPHPDLKNATGASPVLPAVSRKRKSSIDKAPEEPLAKRMAENQLLEAINGIKTSVSAMEQQMRTVPSKADLGSLVDEIRSVRECVIRNTDRIDTLFDLRKMDGESLSKKVEQLVHCKMAAAAVQHPKIRQANGSENERCFLRSRRSVRIWPVRGTAGLEQAVKDFLLSKLKIPTAVIDGLVFEKVEKQSQTRRSKIQDEVLVMLESSQQRDVIQSYAPNLAPIQGQAGLRLDVPDFLRGLPFI